MLFTASKYLMKDGSIRMASFRPSSNIHRSNIDVTLARMKMYRTSLDVNGFIVDSTQILRGNAAKKFIAHRVHLSINSFDVRPMSKRERLIAKERCAIAYTNLFQPNKQWSTLVKQACVAFTLVKAESRCYVTAESLNLSKQHSQNCSYVCEFKRIVHRVGLERFEQVLRGVGSNDYLINTAISDALVF